MLGLGVKSKSHSKPRTMIGLDIGSHSVKIAQIACSDDKYHLTGIALKRSQGASSDELIDGIKSTIHSSGISSKEACISLSGPSVIVRFISMPKMSEDELKGAMRFEAEKFIPFNINDCMLDFQILKKDKPDNKIDVLLAAAKKEFVLDRIKIAEAAGLTVTRVDVDSFALINSFLANFKNLAKEKTTALLNMGAKFTNLSILNGDTVAFVRDVAIGSNDINTAIAKGLNIDLKAAEELKLLPKDKAQEVASSAKTVLNNLFDDIKLSFGYHENQSGKTVDEVYISGGGSETAGFEALFGEYFGMKPAAWNPFGFLEIEKTSTNIDSDLVEKKNNYFAVAAGLAQKMPTD